MKTKILACFILASIVLYTTYCSDPTPKGTIYKSEDYGDKWPFSVQEIDVYCAGYNEVYFTSGDQTYALNGSARSAAESGNSTETHQDMEEIWKDNPQFPGSKIMIPSEFIENALEQCR